MTRKRKLLYNTITSLLYQLITLSCGLILPRYFLQYYGSATNGLISSISQFLGLIALAECGVGAVVQSALYKPLAEKDSDQISRIIVSSDRFFKKIALLLVIYTGVMMVTYPFINIETFGYFYTLSLVFVISISSFAQYYFCMSYRILLSADQAAFIQLGVQCVTILLNTVVSMVLIHKGAEIQVVKAGASLIFLLQPLALNFYIKKHYKLDKKLKLNGEPIKQKWNGLAQHIASAVLGNTDIVVLTFFSTLENVSIYAVYNFVVTGVKQILVSLTTGMQSMLGDMYARKETNTLLKTFDWIEWVLHTAVVYVFTCTAILIIPFVSVYTVGITDTNYIVPVFAILITAAQASYCLRLPYNMMVLAAGHYRETQWSAMIEAAINIIISVVLVVRFGLIGVAIGTLAAMLYRTTYLAWYLSKNILKRNLKHYFKHIIADCIFVLIAVALNCRITLGEATYLVWIWMAVKVSFISLLVLVAVNLVAYRTFVINIVMIADNILAKICLGFRKNERGN